MLTERGKQIRRDTIALSKANGGYHYGGSFSCVEILIALFDHVIKPEDRFILSKGHACWPYYVLLREQGFNPKLFGHPERDPHNGILCTTGSLGHGLPNATGMALGKRLKDEPGRVFVLMGDGECQAGTTWETMQIAGQHKLSNLTAIVDWNGIQGSNFCHNILTLGPGNLMTCAQGLGWDAFIINDGHMVDFLVQGIEANSNGEPRMIIALTTKGKGVSFMENNPKWHSNWLDPKMEKKALDELC